MEWKILNTETGCNTHAQSSELVKHNNKFPQRTRPKTQADRACFTVILSINPYKDYHNKESITILFFKMPTVQNNHQKNPWTQHQYTVQISHNSLRKTQTASNPEPKIDSKGRETIMDGRVRNPYLENPARGRELDCMPPSTEQCGASTTTRAKNQNASMTRVTGSRVV
jgi:hypothetical protein